MVTVAVVAAMALATAVPAWGQAGCQRWVAPSGDDADSGSRSSPWATIDHAAEAVPDTGCTVWVLPGVYRGHTEIQRRFSTGVTFQAVERYRAVFEHDGTVLDVDGAANIAFHGLEFRHSGPGADGYVVLVDRDNGLDLWAENIAFRDNIFHDSYDNDLLKIHNGVRNATVSGNVFYNNGTNEEHMDVNSVTDVLIQDNIFFNDFEASDRPVSTETKSYIVVKDSNEGDDGLLGAKRVSIRRNLFLNWQGGDETFIQVGNDGKPYHEAEDVSIDANLFLLNSGSEFTGPVGIRGVKDVQVTNNTIVGDQPAGGFAYWLNVKDQNPLNRDIVLANNIWSSPGGTMDRFSAGDITTVEGLRLIRNLYWNDGRAIPEGAAGDMSDDPSPIVADPRLPDLADPELPVWKGDAFASGAGSIRSEFLRLADRYALPAEDSVVIGAADSRYTGVTDLVGGRRDGSPDLGAREVGAEPAETVSAFIDIAGSVHASAIHQIADAGITKGCNPPFNDRFCPRDPVTRGQMAAFFSRALGLDATEADPFVDDDESVFEGDIGAIARAGVTVGCDPPDNRRFCPEDTVTRGQMAAFIRRALGLPPPSVDRFVDDDDSVFESDIESIASAGITKGCNPPLNDRFCPHDRVTREEMASFLARAFLG